MRTIKDRDSIGRVVRRHDVWSLDDFDDGYIDAKGRFRVYYPNHIGSSTNGYILRSIVAYEIYNNDNVTILDNVHHLDENRLNDSKENLTKIKHVKHSELHNKKRIINEIRICKNCGNEFITKRYRKTRYCSINCYYLIPKSKETLIKLSNSLRLMHRKKNDTK